MNAWGEWVMITRVTLLRVVVKWPRKVRASVFCPSVLHMGEGTVPGSRQLVLGGIIGKWLLDVQGGQSAHVVVDVYVAPLEESAPFLASKALPFVRAHCFVTVLE